MPGRRYLAIGNAGLIAAVLAAERESRIVVCEACEHPIPSWQTREQHDAICDAQGGKTNEQKER